MFLSIRSAFVNNTNSMKEIRGQMQWQLPFQYKIIQFNFNFKISLKISNPFSSGLSLELALKNLKNSNLNYHKSRSGADIDLFYILGMSLNLSKF